MPRSLPETGESKAKFLLRNLLKLRRPPKEPADLEARERGAHALSIATEVRVSNHRDGLVLLHVPSGKVFMCNRTGARVWHGLSQGLTLDAIAEEISGEYGVARELVEQHTASFVTDLEQRGFVIRPAGVDV